MRIRPSIPSEDFPDKDQTQLQSLDRRELADSLTSLYSSLEEPSVGILHGRWGVGKSTFARRWARQLSDRGIKTVYFDAFSSDYMQEPFDALVAAILRESDANQERKDGVYSKFLSSAAAVSKRLAITGAKAGVRVVTLNALEASDFEDLAAAAKGVAGDAAELTQSAVENLLKRQAEDLAVFELFRKALSDLVEGQDATSNEVDAEQRRCIFIVDELDRCRPDFALGLLECLKHFFRAKGVHFLLVTNKEYLRRSVAARYGIDDAAEEYLQKFYDFTIYFEKSAQYESENRAAAYARKIIDELLGTFGMREQHDLRKLFVEFAMAYDLSLRQIEQIATNLVLAYTAVRDNAFKPSHLILVLAIIKSEDSRLYERLRSRSAKYEEIDQFLDQGNWPESSSIVRVAELVRYYTDPNIEESSDEWRGLSNGVARYNFHSRLDVIPHLINYVMETFAR